MTAWGPLVFEPYLRPQVWGNQRLRPLLGKAVDPQGTPIGESWELSGHPLHESRVCEGPLTGRKLNDLWQTLQNDDRIPLSLRQSPRFPWLIKFLDCEQPLSVQVHPNDEQVRRLQADEVGKTEAWYILHADPGSPIFLGWRKPLLADEIRSRSRDGTLEEVLQRIEPRVGDTYFVPAGTVHAIGGGIVLLEVQQPSDATFRLFDWNRRDAAGQGRPLHLDQAIECVNVAATDPSPLIGTPLAGLAEGATGRRLVTCDHFELTELRLTAPSWPISTDGLSAWVVVTGTCELSGDDGFTRRCAAGQTILLPPTTQNYHWRVADGEAAMIIRVTPPSDR